jgi:hypothetical protein
MAMEKLSKKDRKALEYYALIRMLARIDMAIQQVRQVAENDEAMPAVDSGPIGEAILSLMETYRDSIGARMHRLEGR